MIIRAVSTISTRFRAGATAAMVLAGLAGCAPMASSEDGGSPEGQGPIVISGDSGGPVLAGDGGPVGQITLHVDGLRGVGLRVGITPVNQQIEVPADGTWTVPLSAAVADVQLWVLQQPTKLDQTCDIVKLAGSEFTIACRDVFWSVSGAVHGLTGKGLVLQLTGDGAAPETLAIAASGAYQFETLLDDDTHYEVSIVEQPTEPRQTCTVTNGVGFADGANVTGLDISCVTKTYVFTSVVTGLVGKGLKIKTGAATFDIDKAGTTTYSDEPYPDGFHYDIAVAAQPTEPDQVCYISDGKGIIDGADVTYNIICDAAGTLRISEVGACPYSNSSCWFEIVNVGAQAEQLAFYRVRTSAISPSVFTPARVFSLPPIPVPPLGTVVVAGKSVAAIADGQGVYHIADDDLVPWWGADGFIELLNASGATASFVRFGANRVEPMTGGSWEGTAAPALPRGTGAYGYSLQHVNGSGHSPSTPEDWSLRAFSTYAGGNDVVNDIDTDHDGIPDSAETAGGTFAGLNLYGMGARVGMRDVFVEIDYMAGGDPAVLPRKDALDKLVDTFLRHDVAIHFDVGNLYSATFDPARYNLGGGNEVPFASAVGLAPTDTAIKDLYDIKAEHMEGRRRMVFYYQLFAWSQQKDGSGGSSGVGELPGNDSIITLGGFGLTANTNAQRNLITNYQAASIMHELGHNFGLRHGGGDQLNRKPNYVSVMNYLYSPLGLPTIGNAEGDRYDLYKRCKLSSVTQLTNAPSGDVSKFVLDYSSGGSINLDETSLLESAGLGRSGSGSVDYNCNGQSDDFYSRDLNADGALDVLTDNDDWNVLDLVFRRSAAGAENGNSLLLSDGAYHDDPLTADTLHRSDEVCPAPMMPSPEELTGY
jgi:Metallo-peptidase family M12B Reprolysin-like